MPQLRMQPPTVLGMSTGTGQEGQQAMTFLFLIHDSVEIFRVRKEGDGFLRQFSYSTRPNCEDGDEGVFDVRDLSTWQGTGQTVVGSHYPVSTEFAEIERAIRAAISTGEVPGGEVQRGYDPCHRCREDPCPHYDGPEATW